MSFDPSYDPLREYDLAVVSKVGGQVVSPTGGKPYYAVAVPGIQEEVRVNVGLPEDWYTTHQLPALNVTRRAVLPAPSRTLPNFRARERSTNPETPNTWNIQQDPPQAVNLMYEVELATASEAQMNRLVQWLLGAMPTSHFGTFLVVFDGTYANYHSTGMKDKTNYKSKDGRKFVYEFNYTVEGWFIPSLECEKVPEVLTVDIAVETHKSRRDLHREPPVTEEDAEEVVHLLTSAPEPL